MYSISAKTQRRAGLLLIAFALAGVAWYVIDGYLRPNATYTFPYPPPEGDTTAGPYTVTFLAVTPIGEPPADRLRISSPEGERTVPLIPNDTVQLSIDRFRIVETRPWSGLMHDEHGQPMAAVSVRQVDGPWTDNLFLIQNRVERLDPGLALMMLWTNAIEQPFGAKIFPETLGIEQARWGVRDTNRVHWFNQFTPGVGVKRDDGALVALLEFQENHDFSTDDDLNPAYDQMSGPALHVAIRTDSQSQSRWIPAEVFDEQIPIIFEHPGLRPHAFVVHAGLYEGAHVAYYEKGQIKEQNKLRPRQAWTPDGSPFEIRIEQTMEEAVPVSGAESPFREAVLESPEQRVCVRQGEAFRVGRDALRYVRMSEQVPRTYNVTIDPRVYATGELTIEPDNRYRFFGEHTNGAIEQLESGQDLAAFPERGLKIETYAFDRGRLIGIGVLFLVGVALIIYARRQRPD